MAASRSAEAAPHRPVARWLVATHEWTQARRAKLIGGILASLLVCVSVGVSRIDTNPDNLAS
jgi:hypothetical protein